MKEIPFDFQQSPIYMTLFVKVCEDLLLGIGAHVVWIWT
jgi:hypothetical protein